MKTQVGGSRLTPGPTGPQFPPQCKEAGPDSIHNLPTVYQDTLQTLGTQRRAGQTWAHPHPNPPRPGVGTNLGGPAEGKGGPRELGLQGRRGTAGPGPHARQTGSPKNTLLNSRGWDLDPMVPGLNVLTQRVTMAALRDPGVACSRCLIEAAPPRPVFVRTLCAPGDCLAICWWCLVPFSGLLMAPRAPRPLPRVTQHRKKPQEGPGGYGRVPKRTPCPRGQRTGPRKGQSPPQPSPTRAA